MTLEEAMLGRINFFDYGGVRHTFTPEGVAVVVNPGDTGLHRGAVRDIPLSATVYAII